MFATASLISKLQKLFLVKNRVLVRYILLALSVQYKPIRVVRIGSEWMDSSDTADIII